MNKSKESTHNSTSLKSHWKLKKLRLRSPCFLSEEQVKNIVTDNRNTLDATTIRILATLKARGSLRDEPSIIADSFQDMRVIIDTNQDVSVADDTTAAVAGDASSAQSSAASSYEKCVSVSSDNE